MSKGSSGKKKVMSSPQAEAEKQSRGTLDLQEESPSAVKGSRRPDHDNSLDREKTKKRKRVQQPELEIDIDMPEPPSKKALRRAKKQKADPQLQKGGDSKSHEHNDQQNCKQQSKSDAIVETETMDVPKTTKSPSRSIWIGNIPFHVTKHMLHTFLSSDSDQSQSIVSSKDISRIHMPTPQTGPSHRGLKKCRNKGFAYVDFTSEKAFETALLLSEKLLEGRKVLIKRATDFAGRPDKVQSATTAALERTSADSSFAKPARRVFVGNLAFDVTEDDLRSLFEKCGPISNVKLATFEDSGKCKGFGWVVFETLEASEAAVRGWLKMQVQDEEEEEEEMNQAKNTSSDNPAQDPKRKDKPKTKKIFANRLRGREVRCEFAEDAGKRYRRRFGKESSRPR